MTPTTVKVSVYLKDGNQTVFLKTTKDMTAAFKLIVDVSKLIGFGNSFIVKELV